MRRFFAWLAPLIALGVLLSGCGEKHVHGILVVVRARGAYVIPSSSVAADELRIEVFGKTGQAGSQAWTQTGLYTTPITPGSFPFPYALVPRGGDTSRLYMTVVTLLRRSQPLEEKIAIGTFPQSEPDRVLYFDFVAETECFQHLCRVGDAILRTVPCANSRTECVQQCEDGRCVEVQETDPNSLDPLGDGSVNNGDGSAPDAGLPDATDDAVVDDAIVAECADSSECDDGDPCTDDTCELSSQRCRFTAMDCGGAAACTTNACNPVSGMCEVRSQSDDTACASGICCGGACVDDADVAHCGACGTPCSVNERCTGTGCECEAGYDDCDETPGCEARVTSDDANCGACGNECATGTACIDPDGAAPPACSACMNDGECDDGLTCTVDTCSGGACTHAASPTACLIAGRCYASGDPSPTMPCARCNPAVSTTDWSPNPGAACTDTTFCTVSETCGATLGVCESTPRSCPSGGPSPCTRGTCNEATDACETEVLAGSCVIDGACVADGTMNASNTCQACAAATSVTGWSARTGASCNDSMFCTNPDTCTAAGTCSGAPRSCADSLACTADSCGGATCSNVLMAGNCLIDGTCYGSGAAKGIMGEFACSVCDPAMSMTAWSFAPAGTMCGVSLICNGAGGCVSDGGGS